MLRFKIIILRFCALVVASLGLNVYHPDWNHYINKDSILVASHQDINTLHGLEKYIYLVIIDMSHNSIENVENLGSSTRFFIIF